MYTVISSAIVALTLLNATMAYAANVDVNVNIGVPPVVVREAAPLPPPPRRTVIIEDIPEFIYPDPLGFYVAVGVPYDLFYFDGYYYMYRDRKWHRGYDYNGPWRVVREKHIPYGLRKHKFESIRHYRDREYGIYQRERDHYRGRHFRPDKEWKERRKHEKHEWKEDRKHEKQSWKDERKHGRDDSREERRHQGQGRHGRDD